MKVSEAILAALSYHDIFDFPLTAKEIHKYLIVQSNDSKIEKELTMLLKNRKLGKRSDLYFLKGKESNFIARKTRQKISKSKVKIAKIYAKILKIIPSVKLVAISGALAMENSTKNDDIDFVIITQKEHLWTSRFLANILLFPFKRSPNSKKQHNKACLNIFIDETDLKIKEQNLYTAHEICQLKLLWDRDRTYQKFLKSNSWIKGYLPNWKPQIVNGKSKKVNRNIKKSKTHSLFTIDYLPVENFLKNFQLNYMQSKITTEKIGDRQLFFHPSDNQTRILTKYKKILEQLKIASS